MHVLDLNFKRIYNNVLTRPLLSFYVKFYLHYEVQSISLQRRALTFQTNTEMAINPDDESKQPADIFFKNSTWKIGTSYQLTHLP